MYDPSDGWCRPAEPDKTAGRRAAAEGGEGGLTNVVDWGGGGGGGGRGRGRRRCV